MQRLAAAQWTNQKVIEKRIGIFDELAPLLNDLSSKDEIETKYQELMTVFSAQLGLGLQTSRPSEPPSMAPE